MLVAEEGAKEEGGRIEERERGREEGRRKEKEEGGNHCLSTLMRCI